LSLFYFILFSSVATDVLKIKDEHNSWGIRLVDGEVVIASHPLPTSHVLQVSVSGTLRLTAEASIMAGRAPNVLSGGAQLLNGYPSI